MRLLVLPRSAAAALALDVPYAVVSICDKGDRPPEQKSPLCRGVLHLGFSDVGEGNPGAMDEGHAADKE